MTRLLHHRELHVLLLVIISVHGADLSCFPAVVSVNIWHRSLSVYSVLGYCTRT